MGLLILCPHICLGLRHPVVRFFQIKLTRWWLKYTSLFSTSSPHFSWELTDNTAKHHYQYHSSNKKVDVPKKTPLSTQLQSTKKWMSQKVLKLSYIMQLHCGSKTSIRGWFQPKSNEWKGEVYMFTRAKAMSGKVKFICSHARARVCVCVCERERERERERDHCVK